jgi:hypothetical protein
VLQEIQKITQELEKEKADNAAAMKKTDGDLAAKDRELDIKDRELSIKEAEPVADHDAQRLFDADQAHRDRQVDLAKTIINKAEAGDTPGDMEAAQDLAMGQAAELLND